MAFNVLKMNPLLFSSTEKNCRYLQYVCTKFMNTQYHMHGISAPGRGSEMCNQFDLRPRIRLGPV